jgi:acetoin utilization deacetylase AcuC-like enzyme
MSKKCGLLLDERFFKHAISQPSPENPKRLKPLYSIINNNFRDSFYFLEPRQASVENIIAAHSTFYLDQLTEHLEKADPFSYDRDTYLMEDSYTTAVLAAGGCLEMADCIMSAEFDHGFALIRPPGHHAEPGRGMGFCILNNIGITAKYLQETYKLKRILILDFDVHHGNGTQEMFYESDNVLVVSLHQSGLFPFSGSVDEMGNDSGKGYNINIPVFAQFGDQEYTFLIGRLLQGIVEQFMPQIILVSAGYDGHKDDNMSGTLLTTEWFGTITTMLKQFARETCDNRLMYILEGGYNPVSLEASVLSTLESMRRHDLGKIGILDAKRALDLLHNHPLQRYWTVQ